MNKTELYVCEKGKTCKYKKSCEHSVPHDHGGLCEFDCYVCGKAYRCEEVETDE